MAALEQAILLDPRATEGQRDFIERAAARRKILDHLRAVHGRVYRTSYISLEELHQIHQVLDEAERGE